jgi:hypothetical protein
MLENINRSLLGQGQDLKGESDGRQKDVENFGFGFVPDVLFS